MKEIAALEGVSQKSTCGHSDHKLRSRDSVGKEYELSGSSVSRLMRLNHLIPEFKTHSRALRDGRLSFMAAVHLSYLNEEEQNLIYQVAEQEGKKLRPKQAEQLRKHTGKINREAAENVFRCPRSPGLRRRWSRYGSMLEFTMSIWRMLEKQMLLKS